MYVCLLTTQVLGQPPGHRRNARSYIMGLHELEISDVTQAVNRRLSLLNAGEVYVGFMADKLSVGRFLSGYFGWTVCVCVYIYIYIIPLTLHVLGMAVGLFVTAIS